MLVGTSFHTITAEDVDEWCYNWPVWLAHEGHFTHEPRAVTMELWEPVAKESVQRPPSQHTPNIM